LRRSIVSKPATIRYFSFGLLVIEMT